MPRTLAHSNLSEKLDINSRFKAEIKLLICSRYGIYRPDIPDIQFIYPSFMVQEIFFSKKLPEKNRIIHRKGKFFESKNVQCPVLRERTQNPEKNISVV